MFSETHCHLKDDGSNNLERVVNQARRAGVELVLNAGSNPESSRQAILVARKYSIVRACVGLHPWNSNEYSSEALSRLKALAGDETVVAISEIGLDYAGRRTPDGKFTNEYVDKQIQRTAFREQLKMAVELGLPVIVHDRTTDWEVLDTIEKEGNIESGAAIHGFSKGLEYAKRCVEMGIYLSIGLRTVTAPMNADLKEAIRQIPVQWLLTETDSGNPEGILTVAEKIANLRGVSRDDIGQAATENLRRFVQR